MLRDSRIRRRSSAIRDYRKVYGQDMVNSALFDSPEPGEVISIRCQPFTELPEVSGPSDQSVVTSFIPAASYVRVCSEADAPSLRSHLYLTVTPAFV